MKMASRSIDLISKKNCTCSTLFVFLCSCFAQLQRCFVGLKRQTSQLHIIFMEELSYVLTQYFVSCAHVRFYFSLGTLRSNDADDNENVKKTIGLISKTTTSHVHHTFLYISFPFLHDYDVKMPNLEFCGGREQATTKFYFSF